MGDLVAFLNARLDEDEATALACAGEQWSADDEAYSCRRVVVEGSIQVVTTRTASQRGIHIARHDPARVLREVEAKRRIVAEHTCQCPDPNCQDCGACSGRHHADPEPAPCATVRLLALPYASHPDYRDEWRP